MHRSPVNPKQKQKNKKHWPLWCAYLRDKTKTKEKHKQNISRCTLHSSTANKITKT